MPAPSAPTPPAPPLRLDRAGALRPLPAHAVLWRVAWPRTAAAHLLARIASARLPCVISGTRAPDDVWTLYLWAPGHNAALLGVLLASGLHAAAIVPVAQLPDAPWWACGQALVRLLGPVEHTP